MLAIEAISPSNVILLAGHRHHNPRAAAIQRYVDSGVPLANIFRTDFGDDESSGDDDDWNHGRIKDHRGRRGDDGVEILIRANGELEVEYRQPH